MLESSLVYRKGASASGVNEVAAPRDSINLLKNAVSDRVSGGNEGFAHTLPIASFATQNLY